MGRSFTLKYHVDFRDQGGWKKQGWLVKDCGAPTEASLEKWRVATNRSMHTGGVNAHVATALGYVPHISAAHIMQQSNGRMMAAVKAPMFEVVGPVVECAGAGGTAHRTASEVRMMADGRPVCYEHFQLEMMGRTGSKTYVGGWNKLPVVEVSDEKV